VPVPGRVLDLVRVPVPGRVLVRVPVLQRVPESARVPVLVLARVLRSAGTRRTMA
jgi:hypothetical protein